MGTYAVVVSRHESMTLYVEAASDDEARDRGVNEARDEWDPDTRDLQVDDVRELDEFTAARFASVTIGAEG